MPRLIILAPSAAGKSRLVTGHPSKYIHGDSIIKSTIGWPKSESPSKPWILQPEAAIFHRKAWLELLKVRDQPGDEVILFNGDVPNDLPAPDGIVLLPVPVLEKQAVERRQASPNRLFPRDTQDIIDNLSHLRAMATKRGVAVTTAPSLQAGVDELRAYLLNDV